MTLTAPTSACFFRAPNLTPSRFSGMPAYLQTEACLLAQEFGYTAGLIAAAIDLPEGAVRSILRARHAHNPFGPERKAAGGRGAAPSTHTVTQWGILQTMADVEDRAVPVSTDFMAGDMGIDTASISRAIRKLVDEGSVKCVRSGRPGLHALYVLTGDGIALAGRSRMAP